MSQKTLYSRVVAKSPVYYGWIVLVVGTLGVIMSSPGQTYSFSIFIEEFIRDLDISRTVVSSLYTVGTITGSLALPFIGRKIDQFGNRVMVIVITLAFGITIIYMGFVRNTVMLLLGVVFMRMLGQSSMVIVSTNLINQWWVRRRGFVMGISTLVAATLGTGLFPNLINQLIPRFGWRTTYAILATIVVGTMLPAGYFFFRNKPESYGLLPDGDLAHAKDDVETLKAITEEENWTAPEAVRTSAFWLISACVGAISMLGTGLTFHIVSIFADNGLSADLAAAIFLPMSLTTSLFGIPGGWLIDRIDAKYMLSAGMILLTTTILFSNFIGSVQLAVVYGIVFGLTLGFGRVIGGVVWANYFGRTHLGAITGITSTIGSAASGLGPLIYGAGRDLAGTYWPSLWLSALFPAALAIAVLFMRRPQRTV